MSDKELLDQLLQRKKYLEHQLSTLSKRTDKLHPKLSGKILVKKHGKGYQYYLRDNPKDAKGHYLRKSQSNNVHELLQRDYYNSLIKAIKEELNCLNQYINKSYPTKMMEIYSNMSEGRKSMINPFEIDDKEYVKIWESVKYEGKGFSENAPEHYTNKGERVRSKSEVLIANALYRFHIPYRYEYPVAVKNYGIVYPDFTVLNVKKRKEIHLEHFGLLDDSSYRNDVVKKLVQYEMTGITLGDNLLITFETYQQPLNDKYIETIIKNHLI